MKITGNVVNVYSKTITRPGKRSFNVHYVELDTGKSVNVGFKQPFIVGQAISVDAEMAYGELKMGAVATTGGGEVTPIGSAPSSGGGKSYSSGRNDKFPVPTTHGDFSIIRQNALTNAVNTVMNSSEGIVATDETVERIIAIAYKFADFSSGQREVKLSKSIGTAMLTGTDG